MAMVCPKGSHGAYREQIVLDQRAVVPCWPEPVTLKPLQLPMNGLTARQSRFARPSAGQVVAVTSAGAYGGYAIQLAKADGLTVRMHHRRSRPHQDTWPILSSTVVTMWPSGSGAFSGRGRWRCGWRIEREGDRRGGWRRLHVGPAVHWRTTARHSSRRRRFVTMIASTRSSTVCVNR